MHRRIRKSPADGWRLVGVRWRHHGALWDVELGVGTRELAIGWERYGAREGRSVLSGRGSRAWYWVVVLGLILALGYLVAVGRL
jgi:hypothetical protein